jgi:hypothetical protein
MFLLHDDAPSEMSSFGCYSTVGTAARRHLQVTTGGDSRDSVYSSDLTSSSLEWRRAVDNAIAQLTR